MQLNKIMKIATMIVTCCLTMFLVLGCKKLTEINEPRNSLTTVKVFQTEANARSAIAGIYDKLRYNANQYLTFANGGCTIFTGLSADELLMNGPADPFQTNSLLSDNNQLNTSIWQAAYQPIYLCNAAIEGLQNSAALTDQVKKQLTGEAKFLRAFCYFYLVNLFGDVPLTVSSDWTKNYTMARTAVSDVYEQMISDLKDAKMLLPKDFSATGNERIVATHWAATALLARVNLYKLDWKAAEEEANQIIASPLFYLTDLGSVFLKNSLESIFQLQPLNSGSYSVAEAFYFIPENLTKDYPPDIIAQYPSAFIPPYYMTDNLIHGFEVGDIRLNTYLYATDSIEGVVYYYPYKYKIRQGTSGDINEYYTILRLAEQYLIRAEARAQQNSNLSGAIADLNAIRKRAGLPNLSSSLSQSQIIDAAAQERRIELVAEWGHRWLDLKRTGKANTVLAPVKGNTWQTTDQLYPIPAFELKRDANLSQNPGYN